MDACLWLVKAVGWSDFDAEVVVAESDIQAIGRACHIMDIDPNETGVDRTITAYPIRRVDGKKVVLEPFSGVLPNASPVLAPLVAERRPAE